MARVEVIAGAERRRSWSEEQKRAIVAESLAPGAIVSEVDRRANVCPRADLSVTTGIRDGRKGLHAGADRPPEPAAGAADGAAGGEPAIEVEFAGKVRGRYLGRCRRIWRSRSWRCWLGDEYPPPPGIGVWLAVGHTNIRRSMNSLAIQVQEDLRRDPHAGAP
jgi:hypothetical protein